MQAMAQAKAPKTFIPARSYNFLEPGPHSASPHKGGSGRDHFMLRGGACRPRDPKWGSGVLPPGDNIWTASGQQWDTRMPFPSVLPHRGRDLSCSREQRILQEGLVINTRQNNSHHCNHYCKKAKLLLPKILIRTVPYVNKAAFMHNAQVFH